MITKIISSSEELVNMKEELFHLGASDYGITVLVENILVKDDVLFLMMSLRNRSAVSYAMSAPRFAIESKQRKLQGTV